MSLILNFGVQKYRTPDVTSFDVISGVLFCTLILNNSSDPVFHYIMFDVCFKHTKKAISQWDGGDFLKLSKKYTLHQLLKSIKKNNVRFSNCRDYISIATIWNGTLLTVYLIPSSLYRCVWSTPAAFTSILSQFCGNPHLSDDTFLLSSKLNAISSSNN